MADKLVIVCSRGFDDERASVAWSIANGAINSGLLIKQGAATLSF